MGKQWETLQVGEMVFVHPLEDLRGHEVESALCPCLPREHEDGRMVVHNSYDGREIGEACSKALDLLGLALTRHRHTWTDAERDAYEHAQHVLAMHYDVQAAGYG